jgi:hypothetical protein
MKTVKLSYRRDGTGRQKREHVFCGMFHDVIENTYRKNVSCRPFHDVVENTATYKALSTLLMKTKQVMLSVKVE